MNTFHVKSVCIAAFAALAMAATLPSQAAVAIIEGQEWTRNTRFFTGCPIEASGITYAGGDKYYIVDDDDKRCGLYEATIKFSDNGLSFVSAECGPRVKLALTTDLEAIAYDPASGNVWVADELLKTIREYDVRTGAIVSTLDVPPVMKKIHKQYGFESLTISGDGLTMWTTSEESLTCDGPHSSYYESSTNRLVKFTRRTVHDRWQLAAMYPYVTDTWNQRYSYGAYTRRGISDMCALPDGSLLVLERELSRGDGLAGLNFFYSIYRITSAAIAAATDVKDFSSLANGGWIKIEKGSPLVDKQCGWKNYECMCLGKRISNNACELLLMTDGGSGGSDTAMANRLTGLNIHTLNFDLPSSVGKASPVGRNYRFMHGATVSASVYGDGIEPRAYTNRGDNVCTTTWSLPHHNPSSGSGASTTFTVTSDDTLTWNVNVTGRHGQNGEKAPIFMHDTFEECSPGTKASEIPGWSGLGEVIEEWYSPRYNDGYIFTKRNVTHKQVLDATEEDAERTLLSPYVAQSFDDTIGDYNAFLDCLCPRMDMMFEVRRGDLGTPPADTCFAVATDENGRLQLWHLARVGNRLVRRWSPLSNTAYANGDWVHIGVECSHGFDEGIIGRVFVNGVACRFDDVGCVYCSSSDGDFVLLSVGPVPQTLTLASTKADDFVYGHDHWIENLKYGYAQSIIVAPADAESAANGQTYTVASVAATPTAATPAKAHASTSAVLPSTPMITGFGLDCEKRPFVRFTGHAEGTAYRVVRSASIGFEPAGREYPEGRIVESNDGVAVWVGKEPCDPADGAKFYKVEIAVP